MVWPIIRGKSYVGEAFKSMKAVGTAAAQKDGWRYIAIALIDPGSERNCQFTSELQALGSARGALLLLRVPRGTTLRWADRRDLTPQRQALRVQAGDFQTF